MSQPSSAPSQPSEFITRHEAAAMCAITVQLVDKFIKQQRLTAYRFGRAVRIRREDWERLIAEARIEVRR